ncbi:MAG: hypothetical protein RIQ53_3328 [Pseudomonadota bacterium]|jgi:hypothetical protein
MTISLRPHALVATLATLAALAGGSPAALAQTAPGGTFPGTGTTPGTGTFPGTGTAPGTGTTPGTDTSTSSASLVGSTVTISALYPDATSVLASATTTVDAYVTEFACPDSTSGICGSTNLTGAGLGDGETIDIGSTTISGTLLYAFSADGSVNALSFSGLSFGDGYTISGYTLTTNISGFDTSDITLSGDTLTLNFSGLDPSTTSDGTSIGTFTVTLTAAAITSSVPEPAAGLMAGIGALALAGLRRRRAARG